MKVWSAGILDYFPLCLTVRRLTRTKQKKGTILTVSKGPESVSQDAATTKDSYQAETPLQVFQRALILQEDGHVPTPPEKNLGFTVLPHN